METRLFFRNFELW